MANILIVGANQGIGYYIVKRLLEQGHSITVLDVDVQNLKRLQQDYPKTLLPVTADAQNLSSIQNGVAQAIRVFGSIDAAIHNACLCTFDSEPDSDYSIYQKVMDINFFGALRLAKSVLPYMRQAKKGRVIFTSSGVGVTGFENISPYASSKGAIESLAKCLEIENVDAGISFHLFHPPLTNTASADGLPVPKEFKADAQKVGYGLADHLWSKKFVICHSAFQSIQIAFFLSTSFIYWKNDDQNDPARDAIQIVDAPPKTQETPGLSPVGKGPGVFVWCGRRGSNSHSFGTGA